MPWHPVKFLHKFEPPYTSSKNPLFCGMNQLFSYVRLLGFVQKVFVKIGCTDGDAETASRALVSAYHGMMALEHDMIGVVMTNATPLVAPTFSVERMLGTNPICVVIPAGEEPAFVADMATTTAANGKLEILQRKNSAAPAGWIQD